MARKILWILFSLPFSIACRYLAARHRQRFINLIGLIAIAGVALGVMTLIVVLSVMDGFRADIQNSLLKVTPHITATQFGAPIGNYESSVAELESIPGVTAVSPVVEGEGLIQTAFIRRPLPAQVLGILPEKGVRTTFLADCLVKGSWESLDEPNTCVIGSEIASQFSLRVGDQITLITPTPVMTLMGPQPRQSSLTITGVFQSGFFEVDYGRIYTGLATAQSLYNMAPNEVSMIEIRGTTPDAALRLKETIREEAPQLPLYYRTWQELRPNLYRAMETERNVMFVIELLLIVIAAFNIASTLIMMVMEKTRDIGIMKAMGASRRFILKIFLWEGFMIGFIGTMSGWILGVGICLFIDWYKIPLPGGGQVYYISHVPVILSAWPLAVIPAAALAICFVSTLYPAYQASRLQPVEALRYE